MDTNCQVNPTNHQPALMSIKQEINDPSNVLLEPQHNHHSINSLSSSSLDSRIPSTSKNNQSLSNTEMQSQQLTSIKHNQFDGEEYDSDEFVYGEIDDDDDSVQCIHDDQEDEESSIKKPRTDPTQPNAQPQVTRQLQSAPFKKAQPTKVTKRFITVHLQCPMSECPDKFPEDQLNQHMLDVHLLGPHRCQVKDCRQSFDNNVLLWRHLLQAHQHITQWHCDTCHKYFAKYQVLSIHKHLYHQVGHFECSFPGCTFTGEYKGKVVSHYTQKHKPKYKPIHKPKPKPKSDLVCQQSGCDFRTKYTYRLKEHERVHLGIKPFRCKWPHCGFSSSYGRHTLKHIRTQHLDRAQNSNQTVVTSVDPKDYLEVDE